MLIRGIDLIQTLQHLIPASLIPLFIATTYLGSVWVILPGLFTLYWLWDAERSAVVGSAVFGGFALVVALKSVFALPRPPVAMQLIDASGYGFPSGHALDATVTYGALACVVRVGKRWHRVFVASLVIALVALSRVVLGVHYGVDVVVGIALGIGYLIIVMYVLNQRVLYTLFLAIAVAIAGVIVTGGSWESVILLGGVVLALLGWTHRQTDHV